MSSSVLSGISSLLPWRIQLALCPTLILPVMQSLHPFHSCQSQLAKEREKGSKEALPALNWRSSLSLGLHQCSALIQGSTCKWKRRRWPISKEHSSSVSTFAARTPAPRQPKISYVIVDWLDVWRMHFWKCGRRCSWNVQSFTVSIIKSFRSISLELQAMRISIDALTSSATKYIKKLVIFMTSSSIQTASSESLSCSCRHSSSFLSENTTLISGSPMNSKANEGKIEGLYCASCQ